MREEFVPAVVQVRCVCACQWLGRKSEPLHFELFLYFQAVRSLKKSSLRRIFLSTNSKLCFYLAFVVRYKQPSCNIPLDTGDKKAMHIYCTRRAAISILALLCPAILLASVIIFVSGKIQTKSYIPIKDKRIVIIDPGHGDPDGGAVGVDGVLEKDINLAISLKLRNFFQTVGYTVVMTREYDSAIYDEGSKTIRRKKVSDLRNRLEIIQKNPQAPFISIHQNIYKSPKNSGSVVLFSPNNESCSKLAQMIQNTVTEMLQPQNGRSAATSPRKLYILSHAKSPAVIVECGFLSNPEECKLLQNDTYQSKMAFAIFNGVLAFDATQ